jgi:outer membrane protein OmpA-like peptidoglycan-associated protein
MRHRYLLGAGVALALAFGGAQAHAQLNFFGPYPPGAFYLGPEGGWTQLMSQHDKFRVPSAIANASLGPKVNFNSGFNAGVRAGYAWGPWRFEEEYSYQFNSVQSFFGAGHNIVDGNRHTNAIMTNALYDFTFGWPVTPHIGAGIGAVNIADGVSNKAGRDPVQLSRLGINSFSLSGNTWQFGYQGIAGVRYMINPALALDVDYRYLATPDFTLKSKSGGGHPATLGGVSYRTGYNTQNIVASLTMMFGAPPPAAPPPAPPAPPPPPTHQVYLVFFDWDKYNITPEGMQILEAAAAHWKAGGAVQIQVTGYTDLSGPPGYNQRLSERRANAVATVLERLGIPRNDMMVAGRGMNDPRVPTPLGVREPQNRRVEIVFP